MSVVLHPITIQPNPAEGITSQVVLDRVLSDLESRAVEGVKRYGTLLKTHNGRDALQDALDEALDLVMYLTQAIMERDSENLDNSDKK